MGHAAVLGARVQAEETYDKYKDRPFVDVCVRVWHRDRDSAGTLVGSAIAFRLFLFFVPMVLFFTGLLGFLANAIDHEVLDNANITGGLAKQIETALSQPDSTRWIATLLGLTGMAWAGRSLTGRSSPRAVWRGSSQCVPRRPRRSWERSPG